MTTRMKLLSPVSLWGDRGELKYRRCTDHLSHDIKTFTSVRILHAYFFSNIKNKGACIYYTNLPYREYGTSRNMNLTVCSKLHKVRQNSSYLEGCTGPTKRKCCASEQMSAFASCLTTLSLFPVRLPGGYCSSAIGAIGRDTPKPPFEGSAVITQPRQPAKHSDTLGRFCWARFAMEPDF